jgi:Ca-activated chloride channel family protein
MERDVDAIIERLSRLDPSFGNLSPEARRALAAMKALRPRTEMDAEFETGLKNRLLARYDELVAAGTLGPRAPLPFPGRKRNASAVARISVGVAAAAALALAGTYAVSLFRTERPIAVAAADAPTTFAASESGEPSDKNAAPELALADAVAATPEEEKGTESTASTESPSPSAFTASTDSGISEEGDGLGRAESGSGVSSESLADLASGSPALGQESERASIGIYEFSSYLAAADGSVRYAAPASVARSASEEASKASSGDAPSGSAAAKASIAAFDEAGFAFASALPTSTFAPSGAGASYARTRDGILSGSLPDQAPRVDELVNTFDYGYAAPSNGQDFALSFELSPCPWAPERLLLKIGGKAREPEPAAASSLVFVIDLASLTGDSFERVRSSLKSLAMRSGASDRLSIVSIGDGAAVIADRARKDALVSALDRMAPHEGSSSDRLSAALALAYGLASDHPSGSNDRIVLLAGDRAGSPSARLDAASVDAARSYAEGGLRVDAIDFGAIPTAALRYLADAGSGGYARASSHSEGERAILATRDARGLLAALDSTVRVSFDPNLVERYRPLAPNAAGNGDSAAADLAWGHEFTALYELVPTGAQDAGADLCVVSVDYRSARGGARSSASSKARLTPTAIDATSDGFRFASAVAEWALLLSGDALAQEASVEAVIARASQAIGADRSGERRAFIELARASAPLLGSLAIAASPMRPV